MDDVEDAYRQAGLIHLCPGPRPRSGIRGFGEALDHEEDCGDLDDIAPPPIDAVERADAACDARE